MLLLSRKVGEQLIIGENIVVTVLAIQGSRVRIGIEAPPSVAVWREELLPGHPERSESQPVSRMLQSS